MEIEYYLHTMIKSIFQPWKNKQLLRKIYSTKRRKATPKLYSSMVWSYFIVRMSIFIFMSLAAKVKTNFYFCRLWIVFTTPWAKYWEKNVEKRALFENLDIVLLAMDEICDGGIFLEADPNAVVSRVAIRTDDIPIGEQTVAQVKSFDLLIQMFFFNKEISTIFINNKKIC